MVMKWTDFFLFSFSPRCREMCNPTTVPAIMSHLPIGPKDINEKISSDNLTE